MDILFIYKYNYIYINFKDSEGFVRFWTMTSCRLMCFFITGAEGLHRTETLETSALIFFFFFFPHEEGELICLKTLKCQSRLDKSCSMFVNYLSI